jgi:hypothetical protein
MSTTRQVTAADFQMFVTDLATSTKTFVRERIEAATRPLEARIGELSQRLSHLEGAKYCGVWKSDAQYQTGASVTFHNGLWFARADSRGSRPGSSQDWQLASRAHEDRGST